MIHKIESYIKTEGLSSFKKLLYSYADAFEYSCILDSCELNTGVSISKYEVLAAFGATKVFRDLDKLNDQIQQKNSWLFGISAYDLKNHFEDLSSQNNKIIVTPELLYFEPETLLTIDKNGTISLVKGKIQDSFWRPAISHKNFSIGAAFSPISKEKYLNKVKDIHEIIRKGEVYELNYCVPFKHKYSSFSPVHFHVNLLEKSPVPMASFLKCNQLYLCGASMERFLTLKAGKLTSQPIKGTIRKGKDNIEDQALISELYHSEKDRAENVMIVDLVRNDLARISEPGSVEVSELFGIYSYLQVHQMISTIESNLTEKTSWKDIMRSIFPMGSMTGAPKVAAMKLIEELEDFKRGWYSGSVGYISPSGDFDSNVVIRSLVCDTDQMVLNYNAGGAITIDSDPETEWKEVQLKTKAIREVLDL